MKNYLKAGIASLIIGTSAHAQQVVKNVQGNIVKHLAVGNGTSLPNISGGNNINVGDSDEGGSATVYTASNTPINMNSSVYSTTTIPSETIGSTTVSRDTASQQQNIRSTQTNPDVSLSLTRQRARTDINNDGNIDGIITIRERPTLQTNGQPIPVNTKIRLSSPSLTDLATGGTLIGLKNQRYNWNGSERVEMTNSPGGVLLPVLEDRGQYMGVEDFNTLGEALIYPNPSNGPLTIKTNNFNDKKIEIYNLSGQIVERMSISGDTSEINISQLPTGPYIITTEDSDGNKTVNKIIKK